MKNRLLITLLAAAILLLTGCSKSNGGVAPTTTPTAVAVTQAVSETPAPTATPEPTAEPTPEPTPAAEPTPEPTPEVITPVTIWGTGLKESRFDNDLYTMGSIEPVENGYETYTLFGDCIICVAQNYDEGNNFELYSISLEDFSVTDVKTYAGEYMPSVLKLTEDTFLLYDNATVYHIYNTGLELLGEIPITDITEYMIPQATPDGKALVYIDQDYQLVVLEIETGDRSYPGLTGLSDMYVNSVLPGDRVILTDFHNYDDSPSDMAIYDLHTGELIKQFDSIISLEYEPDGTRVLNNIDYGRLVQVCDAETMDILTEIDLGSDSDFAIIRPLWERGLVFSAVTEYSGSRNIYFMKVFSMETGEMVASSAFSTTSYYNANALIDEERGVLICLEDSGNSGEPVYIWDFLNDDNDLNNIYTKFTDLPEILYTKARKLEEKFDIYVYIGPEVSVNRITDYRADICMDPELIEKSLIAVSNVFSLYPEDFFDQLKTGGVHTLGVYITGAFTPVGSNTVSSAIALANTCDYECCLLVDANYANSTVDPLDATLIHEISHWIDKKIYAAELQGKIEDFDLRWNELSPSDFDYLYSYTGTRNKYKYILDWAEGDDMVYYYDSYSQSYPTEDRARLMEHIMTDDIMANNFQSVHLREKLHLYFETVREAFDTSCWPEETFWEQKLKEADERAEYINEHPDERYPSYDEEDGSVG